MESSLGLVDARDKKWERYINCRICRIFFFFFLGVGVDEHRGSVNSVTFSTWRLLFSGAVLHLSI